jgi:uncharacterized tellurite resistance protein B-like protein
MDWSINTAKAFMLLAVVAVDGSFAAEEIGTIKPTLMRAGLSDQEAVTALEEALQLYRETLGGDRLEDALLTCVRRLKDSLAVGDRRAFMTHLVDAALADDRFQQNEHAFLKTLGAAWDL